MLTYAPSPAIVPDPLSAAVTATSTAFKERQEEREFVRDVLGGTKVLRKKASKYLPKYPREWEDSYKRRCDTAVLVNVMKDAVDNCVARPFSRPVQVAEDIDERLVGWLTDIDLEGNNLSQFARNAFRDGVTDGLVHILVEHTNAPGATNAYEQNKAGVRPYLVHVPASNLLAAYTTVVDGTPFVTHARIASSELRLVGYTEVIVTTIRVYGSDDTGQGFCEVWESIPGTAGGAYTLVDTVLRPWPHVPLYTFYAGQPIAPFVIDPPFLDLAHMNVKHFQTLSSYDNNLDKCNFAMLSVDPGGDAQAPIESLTTSASDPAGAKARLEVGPSTVLVGDWKYVEPGAAGLKETATYLDRMVEHMRLMGLDPLQQKPTGGITATASALNESKAQSTLVDWTMDFSDVLDKAISWGLFWARIVAEPKVTINSDFALALDSTDIQSLVSMRASGDLSQKTLWEECQRRGLLGPKFDRDAERAQIDEEGPSLGAFTALAPVVQNQNAQDDEAVRAEEEAKAAKAAAKKKAA